MFTDILIILWIIVLFVAVGIVAWKITHRSAEFPFQNYLKTDIPYITINVQGHLLNMIVDTGCGVSIITANALKNINYEDSSRKVSLQAVTDENLPSGMVTIPFTVNGNEITEDFVIHGSDDFGNFEKTCGITIHGLLGNEFLEKTQCKIDYKKHSITVY